MEFSLPALRREEIAALQLRALFEERGYRLYRMGSFEEYDLYLQNKSFLNDEDIISFTGADGRLLALKPDVTLSIVKNTPAGETRRLYYTESVFRRSRQSGEYREINQMGLEYIGGEGAAAEAEVLRLAAASLAAVGRGALDLSHMGFVEAMLAPFVEEGQRAAALEALWAKSSHAMRAAAKAAGVSPAQGEALAQLAALAGPFDGTMAEARSLSAEIPGAQGPLDELAALCAAAKNGGGVEYRLDFSIRGDADYYNGLVFQGYVQGVPRSVLAGGRYDNLLRRFDKPQGALGFALLLDEVGREEEALEAAAADEYLNVALPKGRLGNKVYALFEKAGLGCAGVLDESRKLVFEDSQNKVRYFLVKPSDVDIYVEHGAADIGVVGKDVLMESAADVLELMDLRLGKCRLAVAGRTGFAEDPARPLRVATKFPAVARRYYAAQSRQVEVIKLHGSIELAPLLGLSDVILDIVETGGTLKENDLAVLAEVAPVSARLIANRAAWRFKSETIQKLVQSLAEEL